MADNNAVELSMPFFDKVLLRSTNVDEEDLVFQEDATFEIVLR